MANDTQPVIKTPVEIQLSFSNPTYRGPKGDQGPVGKSAYDIAVEEGFQGTKAAWLLSLQGEEGPQGHTPEKGIDYFTQEDIEDIIAEIPSIDLDNYATKTYVETAIRGIETGMLKRAIVSTLPVSEIDENTIYMVQKVGTTNNVYDEYLYVNNAWEAIGSTNVDLTGYATEQYVDNGLSGKQSTLTAGSGINLSGSTISVNIEYLSNTDILNIWNNNE